MKLSNQVTGGAASRLGLDSAESQSLVCKELATLLMLDLMCQCRPSLHIPPGSPGVEHERV